MTCLNKLKLGFSNCMDTDVVLKDVPSVNTNDKTRSEKKEMGVFFRRLEKLLMLDWLHLKMVVPGDLAMLNLLVNQMLKRFGDLSKIISCGQISRVSIPKDYKTSTSKGIAYIDFKDQSSFSQALELNGSDLGGYTITVDEARPRADNCDSGWCRGRGSGKGRDGGGQGGGRFGGRRGGRDGGGRRCGGSRGRGPPNRQSVCTASIGKQKTFADD